MRVLGWIATVALVIPVGAGSAPPKQQLPAAPGVECPQTSSHLAESKGIHRGDRPMMKKLNELPPAQAYMSVYRTVAGCESPLTMADYRRTGRR